MEQGVATGNAAWVPGGARGRRAGMVLIGVILFLFLAGGGLSLWAGLCIGRGWVGWAIASVGMASCWGLPVYFFAVMLHRRLTKGRWLLTVEERRERYLRTAGRPERRLTRMVLSPWFDFVMAGVMVVPGVSIVVGAHGRVGVFEVTMCCLWASVAGLEIWSTLRKMRQRRVRG